MQGFVYIVLAFSFSGCLANPVPVDPEPESIATTWEPDPFCPYPSDDIFFYSDPDDCSKFIECYEGIKYVRDCADGLYWSEEELACDFPRNVDCSSRPIPTSPDDPGTEPVTILPDTTPGEPDVPTTAAPPDTTEAPIGTTTADPDKLCENQLDGTYFADPTNCKNFYECRLGKAIIGVCPTGTEWNEEILNCDHPNNVKCPT